MINQLISRSLGGTAREFATFLHEHIISFEVKVAVINYLICVASPPRKNVSFRGGLDS